MIVLTVALLAALCIAYGAYWYTLSDHLRDATLNWIADLRARGYEISYSTMDREGFPGIARIDLTAPTVTAPKGASSWTWSGDRLAAQIEPFDPTRLTLRLDGAQKLTVLQNGTPLTYTGFVEKLTAVLVQNEPLPVGELKARNLTLAATHSDDLFAAADLEMTASYARSSSDAGGDGYDFTVSANNLQVPAGLDLPLGNTIGSLQLQATVLGTLQPPPWPEALERWRDAGGTIEITKLDFKYGPLTVDATGTLALDARGQPMGAFSAGGTGFLETIDILRQREILKKWEALGAKLVLNALTGPPAQGAPPARVPLTLQNQTVFVVSVPVFKVPTINMLAPGAN
jgi:hypothetical protein